MRLRLRLINGYDFDLSCIRLCAGVTNGAGGPGNIIDQFGIGSKASGRLTLAGKYLLLPVVLKLKVGPAHILLEKRLVTCATVLGCKVDFLVVVPFILLTQIDVLYFRLGQSTVRNV